MNNYIYIYISHTHIYIFIIYIYVCVCDVGTGLDDFRMEHVVMVVETWRLSNL